MVADSFTMPIIHTVYSITWVPMQADDDRAKINHGGDRAKINHGGQSLQKLASRGGLDWAELRAILAGEDYVAMSESRAARACQRILEQRTH